MADRGTARFLLLLRGVIERVAEEDVGVAVIAAVAGDDGVEGFGKSDFLHAGKRAAAGASASAYDNQQPGAEQIV